jgi:hypothetical protein
MHQRPFPAHAGLPALRGPWLDREQALSRNWKKNGQPLFGFGLSASNCLRANDRIYL